MPEEEERVPMRPDDPAAPSLLAAPQATEEAKSSAAVTRSEEAKRAAEALLMNALSSDNKPVPGAASQLHSHPSVSSASALPACSQPSSVVSAPQDAGHVNLGFAQAPTGEKDNRNGKPTNLWNPTYGSWFLQQQQKRQQAQAQRQAGSQGHELSGRTGSLAEALGLQHQHKQQQIQIQQQQKIQIQQQQQQKLQQQQQQIQIQQQQKIQQQQQIQIQQQGQCRPLLPPPPQPAPAPLLLDSAALPPVPLYRLRRFPCGNIGYGYQEQGLPLESMSGPQNAVPPPVLANQQRPISLGRTGTTEDSRPLLVTMGTVQDSRLPKMDGHNATVL